MQFVHNFFSVFFILFFGTLYLIGLGWISAGPLMHGCYVVKNKQRVLIQELPFVLVNGLLLNYGITLLVFSLKISFILGGILSLFGFVCFLIPFIRSSHGVLVKNTCWYQWVGIIMVTLAIVGPILVEPLTAWDARSFWFFHAKMIFYAGSIGPAAGWMQPSVATSHFDYPNFVPVLAAQVAYIAGFWNEFLPKASLIFMYIPVIMWIFSFFTKRWSLSFLLLLLVIPFSFYPWLWNGYMDGLLAVYFSLSLLLLGRFLQYQQPIDLLSAFCCLSAVINIKNEGSLALISFIITFFLFFVLQKKLLGFRFKRKSTLAAIIGLFPFILWAIYKKNWGLNNDLGLGSMGSLTRIISRLSDGSLLIIIRDVFLQISTPLILISLLLIVAAIRKQIPNRIFLLPLISAGVYLTGMICVYLSTPADLKWHLNNSVDRTMLPVNGLIYVACFFILRYFDDYWYLGLKELSFSNKRKEPKSLDNIVT